MVSETDPERKRVEPPKYQRVYELLKKWAWPIFIAFGVALALIRNSTWISPKVSYGGIVGLAALYISLRVFLPRYGLGVVIGKELDTKARHRGLGDGPTISFIAVAVVLLLPRFLEWLPNSAVSREMGAMKKLALGNTRQNLFAVYQRLAEIHEVTESAGTTDAIIELSNFPERISRLPNLDASFCRSFELQVVHVADDFLQAAQAYCSTVTGFQETEKKSWEMWSHSPEIRKVMEHVNDVEAQLALICGLTTHETFYISRFEMLFLEAEGMGFSETDLLQGAESLDIPNLTRPRPYIKDYLHKQFHLECPP